MHTDTAQSNGKPKLYDPRHPERTLLYEAIADHFETWLDLASAGQIDGQGDHRTPKPYVRQAFRKYLECSIFARGFASARCGDYGHDYFVAFSCKGRGAHPSCNTRRMVETAAHLMDHVFPRLPVRQWVLSVSKRLRYFMQRDRPELNMVLRIILRVIAQSLQSNSPRAAQLDKATLHIGAVAFIRRFGSSLNWHVHFHVCAVDGVFEGVERFHWTTLEQPLVADRSQPLAEGRFDNVLATKRPVISRLAMSGSGEPDCNWLLPLSVLCRRLAVQS